MSEFYHGVSDLKNQQKKHQYKSTLGAWASARLW